jgi:hypothetical protein
MTVSTSFYTNAFSKTSLSYFLIFFVYSFIFIFSYQLTELPIYEKIPLMDGNQYLKMLNYFHHHELDYSIKFPFNSRVLYIWIASLFPTSIGAVNTFVLLNYFFGLATLCLLFHTWNKLSIPVYLSFFLLFYLMLHWTGIIRQYMVDPVGVDIPYLFCLSIIMYLILFDRYDYLFIVVVLGTAVKEAVLPFIILLLMIKIINKKVFYFEGRKIKFNFFNIDSGIKKIVVALLIGLLCKTIINFHFPTNQTGRGISSIGVVLHCVLRILREPFHILDWLTGTVLFFGVFLFPLLKGMTNKKYLHGKTGEVLMLTLLGIMLAILGGGDHTRIAFLSFPFFFTFVLLYWKDNINSFSWLFYLLPSIYFIKCWRALPTPTTDWVKFSTWYPEYSSYRDFPIEIGAFLLFIIILYFFDKRKNQSLSFEK